MRRESEFISDSEVQEVLDSSYGLEDDVDIYQRFVEERLYQDDKLPTEVLNHLEDRGYDGSADNPKQAMRWLACEIALEADTLNKDADTLASRLASNRDYDRVQDLCRANRTVRRVMKTGVEDSMSYEVLNDLPNKNYSPGRLLAEENETAIKSTMSSISEGMSFHK